MSTWAAVTADSHDTAVAVPGSIARLCELGTGVIASAQRRRPPLPLLASRAGQAPSLNLCTLREGLLEVIPRKLELILERSSNTAAQPKHRRVKCGRVILQPCSQVTGRQGSSGVERCSLARRYPTRQQATRDSAVTWVWTSGAAS